MKQLTYIRQEQWMSSSHCMQCAQGCSVLHSKACAGNSQSLVLVALMLFLHAWISDLHYSNRWPPAVHKSRQPSDTVENVTKWPGDRVPCLGPNIYDIYSQSVYRRRNICDPNWTTRPIIIFHSLQHTPSGPMNRSKHIFANTSIYSLSAYINKP